MPSSSSAGRASAPCPPPSRSSSPSPFMPIALRLVRRPARGCAEPGAGQHSARARYSKATRTPQRGKRTVGAWTALRRRPRATGGSAATGRFAGTSVAPPRPGQPSTSSAIVAGPSPEEGRRAPETRSARAAVVQRHDGRVRGAGPGNGASGAARLTIETLALARARSVDGASREGRVRQPRAAGPGASRRGDVPGRRGRDDGGDDGSAGSGLGIASRRSCTVGGRAAVRGSSLRSGGGPRRDGPRDAGRETQCSFTSARVAL